MRGWEDDIKMHNEGIELEDVDFAHRAQVRDNRCVFVDIQRAFGFHNGSR